MQRSTQVFFIILAAIMAVFIYTVPDYGLSWDEPARYQGGQRSMAYYETLLQGKDPLDLTLDGYPNAFDLPWVALARIFPQVHYWQIGHVLEGLCSLLALVGVWKLGTLLGGPRLGLWAMVFLFFTPPFYGHTLMNPKDIPFCAAYIWGLYYLALMAGELPQWRKSVVIKLGIALGLAMGTRLAGFVLVGYSGLLLSLVAIREILNTGLWPFVRTYSLAWIAKMGVSVFLGIKILLFVWPEGQLAVVAKMAERLHELSHFNWQGPVLFFGRVEWAQHLPRTYLPGWMWITIPEVFQVIALVGVGFVIFRAFGWWRNRNVWLAPASLAWGVIVFGTIFPIIYAIIARTPLYDAWRQMLFVVPGMIILIARSWLEILSAVQQYYRKLLPVIYACMMIALALIGFQYIRLHPYAYLYINSFGGGVCSATGRFDQDYWGLSMREAVEDLQALLIQEGYSSGTIVYVAVSDPVVNALIYFPNNWRWTKDPAKAAFYISLVRYNCPNQMDGDPVICVERYGTPLAIVKDRRSLLLSS
ncbi:MAG: hypothetical protein B7X06_00650 [Verrucomicrobia bacterium 21-51-4]|nr:MAG: hypothetical protein B7X06_00650 [Verrucomicrobia bacterium 21-51-4]HQU08643.1 hypothetical protein [Opitutales bacterium]